MAASALAAGLVTISLLWIVQSGSVQGLPVMTDRDLAVAGFWHEGFREYLYEANIATPERQSDRVWLAPTAAHGVRISLRLGNSAEPSLLVGVLAEESGAFSAGPLYGHETSAATYHIDGRIRGPALVDGVPTVYLEATVRRVLPGSPGYEGRAIRRWSTPLRAAGRTRF